MNSISESDWKKFRKLREVALDRSCAAVLEEAAAIAADPQPSNHEAYCRLYGLMRDQDKELARMFDDPRRGTAHLQLLAMYREGLVSEEELAAFSDETQELIRRLHDV